MNTATIEKPVAKAVDWAGMEPLYRAGQMSLVQLAKVFGVSRAGIHKHAAKAGWVRALSNDAITLEAAFNRGRDLCIAMLSEELENDYEAEALRKYREGRPQHRYTKRFLQALIDDPAMLDGFAAVLSARLGVSDVPDADYFLLPMAEYEPGVVGADGTDPYGEGEAPTSPATASAERPASPAAQDITDQVEASTEGQFLPDNRRSLAFDANFQLTKMAEGLTSLLEMNSTDDTRIYVGMLARIQQLSEIVFFTARLHGDDPKDVKNDDLAKLQRAFNGMLAC